MLAERDDDEEPSRHSDPSMEIAVDVEEASLDVDDEARPRSVPPEVAGLAQLGRYELLGRLAVGGMAEIFLAREVSKAGASRQLVVKIVRAQLEGDDDFETMFLNEGRVAMRLKHPNICHTYEFGRERGRFFIAMEYVNGVTLASLLRRAHEYGGRIPVPILVQMIAEVAEALDAAHRTRDETGQPLDVVHRDVSPHNIMIGFDGRVKLLDFGVAHIGDAETEETGTIKGKFGYLAPEQCAGEPIDGRADLFSLGICFWEGLFGKRLYKRGNEYDTVRAIVEEPVPSAESLGEELDGRLVAVYERALAKSPDDRFRDGAEMQEALLSYLTEERELVNAARIKRYVRELYLEEILAGPQLDRRPEIFASILAHEPSIVPPPPAAAEPVEAAPPPSRAPWLVAVVALAALTVVGLGLALALRGGSDPPVAAPTPAPVADETDPSPVEPEPEEGAEPEASADPGVAEAAPEEPEAAPDPEPEAPAARRRGRRARPDPGSFVNDPGF